MAGQSTESNVQSWHLNKTEIAYNLEKTASTVGDTEAPEWWLFVPKIMPLLTKGLPKDTPAPLPVRSMFWNCDECMPTIQSSIYTRNYIKATRPDNCSFAWPCKHHDIQLEVEVLHQNPDNLRITNTIDNSTPT